MVQIEMDFRPAHRRADPAQLVASFEPMIHQLIGERVFDSSCSDLCMDYDDVVQYGKRLVWEAIEAYDPHRGAKLSTFVHIKLDTKFSNLGRKIKTRKKIAGTMNFTSMDSRNDESYSPFEDCLAGATGGEDEMIFSIEVDNFLGELDEIDREIFTGYFVHGYNLRDLKKRIPTLNTDQIKGIIEALRNSFARRYSEA